MYIKIKEHSAYSELIKFIYSEKATNFCKISTIDLFYVVTVKSMVEILQNFVAVSEYMNFTIVRDQRHQALARSATDVTTEERKFTVTGNFAT